MISNAEVKRISELKERSGRIDQGLFIIEGKRAVLEAIEGGAAITRLVLSLGTPAGKLSDVIRLAGERKIEIEDLPAAKFKKISSTETSQGIVAIASMNVITADRLFSEIRGKRSATLILLDRIADPGNLGTILRSAAWFGVDGVLIGSGSVDAYNPKVVRSAMSAVCQLNVVQEVSLPEEIGNLRKLGYSVVASTQKSNTVYSDYPFPKRCAVLFGSEAVGIEPGALENCDATVTIPRVGKMESLNVSIAASVVLAEMSRQRRSVID